MFSIATNAQVISAIPAKNIPIQSEIVQAIKKSPASDSLRNNPLSCRDNKIYQPLFVVDGRIISNEAFVKKDPQLIENIVVVKGNEAIRMFGAYGINGAFIVTMKKHR